MTRRRRRIVPDAPVKPAAPVEQLLGWCMTGHHALQAGLKEPGRCPGDVDGSFRVRRLPVPVSSATPTWSPITGPVNLLRRLAAAALRDLAVLVDDAQTYDDTEEEEGIAWN